MHAGQGRRERGQQGEREAERFLAAQRYAIIAKNYRSPFGEVDLIALDRHTIVFVEVRTHTGEAFGDPLASVNARKSFGGTAPINVARSVGEARRRFVGRAKGQGR